MALVFRIRAPPPVASPNSYAPWPSWLIRSQRAPKDVNKVLDWGERWLWLWLRRRKSWQLKTFRFWQHSKARDSESKPDNCSPVIVCIAAVYIVMLLSATHSSLCRRCLCWLSEFLQFRVRVRVRVRVRHRHRLRLRRRIACLGFLLRLCFMSYFRSLAFVCVQCFLCYVPLKFYWFIYCF